MLLLRQLWLVLLFCVVTVCGVYPPTVLADEKSTSVAAFAALAQVKKPQLSFDGSKLASLRNFQGQMVVVTRKLDHVDAKDIELVRFNNGEIRWFNWVTNERLLMGVAYADKRGQTETSETCLYAVNWDGSDLINMVKRELIKHDKGARAIADQTQFQDRIVSLLPNDPDHVLVALDQSRANYPDVFKINIHTAQRKRVLKNNRKVVQWYADSNGKIRAGFTRPQKSESKLIFRRDEAQSWQTIGEEESIGEGLPFSFEAFNNDNIDWLYVSRIADNGKVAIFHYDTKKAQYQGVVAQQAKADVRRLMIDRHDNILGFSYFDEKTHRVYNDSFWVSLQKMLSRNFPGQHSRVESYSDDKKKLFIHVTSPTNPGSYFYFNIKQKSLALYAFQYPFVDTTKLAKMHQISYKARDGLMIPASWPTFLLPITSIKLRRRYCYSTVPKTDQCLLSRPLGLLRKWRITTKTSFLSRWRALTII